MRRLATFISLAVAVAAAFGCDSPTTTTTSAPPSAPKAETTKASWPCESDAKTLCAAVTPGEGRIYACLRAKPDQLSEACRKNLQM